MKSGWIVVQENMSFSNMTIAKQRPRSWAVENFKKNFWAEFWNEEQLYLRQQEDNPNSEHRRGYQSKLLIDPLEGWAL